MIGGDRPVRRLVCVAVAGIVLGGCGGGSGEPAATTRGRLDAGEFVQLANGVCRDANKAIAETVRSRRTPDAMMLKIVEADRRGLDELRRIVPPRQLAPRYAELLSILAARNRTSRHWLELSRREVNLAAVVERHNAQMTHAARRAKGLGLGDCPFY